MNDQAAVLRKRFEKFRGQQRAKTVSIVSGKGGVGKSNVALNLSIKLQQLNQKVLLFDLDIGMGNINVLLGLHPKYTVVDMFQYEIPIEQIIETGPEGLSYISGGSAMEEHFLMDEAKRHHFMTAYNTLVGQYDYIIFDMGAGISKDSMFFILASDECIVVTTPEPPAFTDAYSMVKQIINKERNMPIYVVMNRCLSVKQGNKMLSHFKRVVKRFLNTSASPLGLLPNDKAVASAVMNQKPYVISKPKSTVARAMGRIAETYLALHMHNPPRMRESFIEKLKSFFREG